MALVIGPFWLFFFIINYSVAAAAIRVFDHGLQILDLPFGYTQYYVGISLFWNDSAMLCLFIAE